MANSFSWFKIAHGLPSDPTFGVVSRRSGESVPTVIAVWIAVLDFASKNADRGSLDGIDPEEIDYTYRMNDGVSARIIEAMESKGLIADGRVVNWDGYQSGGRSSQGSSSTSAERVRRYRERQKAACDAGNVSGYETHDVTPCNADVTVCNAPVTPCNTGVTPVTEAVTPGNDPVTGVTPIDKIREEKNINTPPYIPPRGDGPALLTNPKPAVKAKDDEDPEGFAEFWAEYPRLKRLARKDAVKAWRDLTKKGTLPELDVLLDAVREQSGRDDWLKEDGKYVPYPATWLRGERWKETAERRGAQAETPKSFDVVAKYRAMGYQVL